MRSCQGLTALEAADRARPRVDGASAHGVDGAAAARRQAGARRADRGRRTVGARHGLRPDARARGQHPGDRSRAGGQGRPLGHLRPHADAAQPQAADRPGPRHPEPDLPGVVRGPARRAGLRRHEPDPERRLARVSDVVPPHPRLAGAQRRGRHRHRARPPRRWRAVPAGDALHRRGPGHAQAGAGHRPGRHRRMVDARLRAQPAGRSPRPYLRAGHRLRALQGQGGGRAGRRRLGDGQCRGGAGARRRGPPLHPPPADRRAALPLAHLRGLPAPHGRHARSLALALHGQHPERARGLSARHLRPRHGLPRHLHHARRARLDRRAHGGGSHPPGDHARAVPRRLRDLRHRHPPERASAARARAVRRQDRAVARPLHAAARARKTRCSRPIPISARTTSSSRRRRATRRGSATSMSSASARR